MLRSHLYGSNGRGSRHGGERGVPLCLPRRGTGGAGAAGADHLGNGSPTGDGEGNQRGGGDSSSRDGRTGAHTSRVRPCHYHAGGGQGKGCRVQAQSGDDADPACPDSGGPGATDRGRQPGSRSSAWVCGSSLWSGGEGRGVGRPTSGRRTGGIKRHHGCGSPGDGGLGEAGRAGSGG